MRGINGKIAVVTGGAQGIGRAVTERIVAEGGNAMIADSNMDHGKRTVDEINGQAGRAAVCFHPTDVADESAVIDVIGRTVREFGGIDQLVNCAAVFIMRGIEATVEEWRRIMDVNIMGQALCVKHAVPEMRTRGAGSIVNIASISGHIAQPGYLTYNATKAAVANMTRCMAMDLACDGIRVNAVNPGTVWNKNNERYHRAELGMNRAQADSHPEIGGKHMLGRTADPEEIAAAVVFLLSDEASYITGENLMVDAGYTAM
ncbi:SDR family NAD(P)-dependent oxidoreductase [Nocardia sp. NPDC052566]|uniref:SDR family NAD(P)-dependent oxidoreductase n=1 Tax=Nocardia sp. NPDC052566 TaxID=3364330 RepID=UPI0037C8A7D9